MNKIYLIGNLTRDPELRYTQSGIPVCDFGIGVNLRKTSTGMQETCYLDVTAWRQLAESCNKYLKKGHKVAVVGYMQFHTYQAKDGTKCISLDVQANEIEFLTPVERAKSDVTEKKGDTQDFTEVEDEDLPF